MAQEGFKRKLAAILSADVTEYSRLMREDETATIRTLTAYREVMTALVKQHHGRVVDTVGDNLLAEFASVVDAVQGAVAIQKEIKTRNAQVPESRKMVFRIGINLGDLVVEGDRIYGDGVNIAARLEALADPGGICISRTAYDQIEDKLPLGYEYLGEKTVKNIVKPVRAYRVLFEPGEAMPSADKAENKRRSERHKKKEGRTKPGERDKPSADKIKKIGARFKIWDGSHFSKHLWVYAGVIGFVFIINVLTWAGVIWFHWPALGWGLLLFLHWINIAKKNGVRDKDKSKMRLHKHLGMYLGVIGFVFIINVLTWAGVIWFHWPALGWGLLLFLHWIKVSNPLPKRKP
ncbi:MAG: adenylate/guanylate cyclase domain-containing protein [Planctomycetota bacterium]